MFGESLDTVLSSKEIKPNFVHDGCLQDHKIVCRTYSTHGATKFMAR